MFESALSLRMVSQNITVNLTVLKSPPYVYKAHLFVQASLYIL